jgi:hypothetical protein
MQTDDMWLKDDKGRTLILRGVNLGGSSKVPVRPDGASYKKESLLNPEYVSFVGRPFPLEEADEHFSRLKAWGFTFLRFLITWEAIEHRGPDMYDEDYLDYLEQVCAKAGDHGISLFIDPHNDMWSRWTGGDGAPAWTMELAGMDVLKFHETGSAFVHSFYKGELPSMIWTTNQYKLGTATMFTLFFGGNDFAPLIRINGEPVQDFLQHHYIAAVKQVVRRLGQLKNVVGYDSLNEPLEGYIGYKHLNRFGSYPLRMLYMPTPYQSMLSASGYPQKVPFYTNKIIFPVRIKYTVLNPGGVTLWKDGHECIWKQHGVWTDSGGKPKLLQPYYFSSRQNREVDFAEDYLKPFIRRFVKEIQSVKSSTIVFIEGPVGNKFFSWSKKDGKNVVNAHHWYDALTLMLKKYRPYISIDTIRERFILGKKRVKKAIIQQIGALKNISLTKMGRIPTLVGEFGIPFDLDKKKAYRTEDFSVHIKALDMYFNAIDAHLLNCTLWNYTADNTIRHGDLWNEEDFSIFSRDLQADPSSIHSGGKAVFSFVRPYAKRIAGRPLSMSFEQKSRIFRLIFEHDPVVKGDTEVFVPQIRYPDGFHVQLSCGKWKYDHSESMLRISLPAEKKVCELTVLPAAQ